MEPREEGLLEMAALLCLGLSRSIRTDLEDWKAWYVEVGREEVKGYLGRLPVSTKSDIAEMTKSMKSDIEALSRKIDGLSKQPSDKHPESLLKFKKPEEKDKDHQH